MAQWIEEGSPSSPIWLVGEAPGLYEVQQGRPFTGPSGAILNTCLTEAGLARGSCFLTNICHERPPTYRDKHGKEIQNDIDQFFFSKREASLANIPEHNGRYPTEPIRAGITRLNGLIDESPPRVIVLLGNTPLWAITGEQGITKWRGSIIDIRNTRTISCYHPADCLPSRSPQHRPLLVADLTRARRELQCFSTPPQWQHYIRPSFTGAIEWLNAARDKPLAVDIETRWSQIACIGLASSATEAICLPFITSAHGGHGSSYWSETEELQIVLLLRELLTRDMKDRLYTPVIWHNGLFDCQYIARQWGFLPHLDDDTMVMMHVLFPGLLGGKIDPVTGKVDKRGSSLSLSFVASLFCQWYSFWKDDGRLFDPSIHDEDRLWSYNCEDCCRTFECRGALLEHILKSNLTDQYRFEMQCLPLTLRMMFRGLRVNKDEMNAQYNDILHQMRATRGWLDIVCGDGFNPESSPQMRALFYHDLAVPVRRDKHTRQPSLKDFDLERIRQSNPLLGPLIQAIQDYRTLNTIKDDVAHSRLSHDGRLRTTLNPDYVETFRYSSSETAFGEGGNLQNIPRSPE